MSHQREPVPIVDTHIHLDEPAFDGDRAAVLASAAASGVTRLVNIGYSPERWRTSAQLVEQYPHVALSLGLHPHHAEDFSNDVARELESTIAQLRPVAIGETGFDLARGLASLAAQRRAFQFQLSLAVASDLPVIIHQREASDQLMAELDERPELGSVVLHSFDGTARLARWALERGCYVGIGGLATRETSAGLRALLETISVDRLLLETDAPYLSPPGTPRRNTPANLPLIADRLAPLWGLTQKELCRATTANAFRLFRFSDLSNGSSQ